MAKAGPIPIMVGSTPTALCSQGGQGSNTMRHNDMNRCQSIMEEVYRENKRCTWCWVCSSHL